MSTAGPVTLSETSVPDFPTFRSLAAAMFLVFCVPHPGLAQENAAAQDANETGALPEHIEHQTIVARIGNINITLGEVIAFRQTLPDQFQQLPDEVLLESILSQIIDQTLLEQAARKTGLEARTAFQLALLNQRRAALADSYMAQTVIDGVSEEAIEALYAEKYANAPPVPEVRTSHIVVKDKSQAEELRARIEAGEDFATLAAAHSLDATAQRGGDRGWQLYQRLHPAFANVARELPEGAISGPIRTPLGWHLIRVDGKRDRAVPPLEVVRGLLMSDLSTKIETETLERLRGDAEVERLTSDVPAAAVRADALIED